MGTTGQTRRTQRSSRQRQRQGGSSARASAPIPLDLTPPTETDYRRYRAFRAGLTVDEIALAEKVRSTRPILVSIQRVKLDNARYSIDETGLAVRRLLHEKLPQMDAAIGQALVATKRTGRKVVMIDKESGEEVTVEDFREEPDHDSRRQMIDSTTRLLAVVQPRDPAIQITNTNTTTSTVNSQVIGGIGLSAAHPGMTSPEAVIRAVVAERQQRALAAPTADPNPIPPRAAAPVIEGELVEARRPAPSDEEAAEMEPPEDDDGGEDGDFDEDEDEDEDYTEDVEED